MNRMIRYNIDNVSIPATQDGYAKNAIMLFADPENIFKGPTLSCCTKSIDAIIVQLAPGEEIPSRRHDLSEEIAFIVRGGGELIQPQQRLEIAPHDVVFLEQGVPHAIRAGSEGLTALFFHSPPMHDRK